MAAGENALIRRLPPGSGPLCRSGNRHFPGFLGGADILVGEAQGIRKLAASSRENAK
jgi:hypothetical protein